MSSNSKKRCRKAKLVPRRYAENEDYGSAEMQVSSIRIVDVKSLLDQSSSSKSEPATVESSHQTLLPQACVQPKTEPYIPFNFSVNIEVEEYDDEGRLEIDENAFMDDQIKAEHATKSFNIDDSIDSKQINIDESIDSEDDIVSYELISPEREPKLTIDVQKLFNKCKRKPKIGDKNWGDSRKSILDSNTDPISRVKRKSTLRNYRQSSLNPTTSHNEDDSHIVSKVKQEINLDQDTTDMEQDTQNPIAENQYTLTESQILSACEKILETSTSVADRKLAVEARNIIGRITKSVLETSLLEDKIQYALDDWRNWTAGSRRSSPVFYKCYLCMKSWWHLTYFREHMSLHQNEFKISVEETSLDECNIIAYLDMVPENLDILTEDLCWQCEKDYDFHKLSSRDAENAYHCRKCSKRFFSCISLKQHELTDPVCIQISYKIQCVVCPSSFGNQIDFLKHMVLYHDVRSDTPIPTSYKKCNECGLKYFIYNMHNCRNKMNTAQCNFCFRKFTHRLLAELHMSIGNDSFLCKVCNLLLPKSCMVLEHVLMHSTAFIFPYKCVVCDDFTVFLNEAWADQHRYLKHYKSYDRKKNFLDKVLVPILCVLPNYESSNNHVSEQSNENFNDPSKNNEPVLINQIKVEIMETQPDIPTQVEIQSQQELDTREIKEEPHTAQEGGEDICVDDFEDDIIKLDFTKYENEELAKRPKIYSCRKCDFQGYHWAFKEHLQSDCLKFRTGNNYVCTKCNTRYNSMKEYLSHFVSHDLEYLSCPVCLVIFQNFSSLIQHFNAHVRQTFLRMYMSSINKNGDYSLGKKVGNGKINVCKDCLIEVKHDEMFRHWERHFVVRDGHDDQRNVQNGGDEKDEELPGLKQNVLDELTTSLQTDKKFKIRDCPYCSRSFGRSNDCKIHIIEHLLADAYAKKPKYNFLKCQICREDFDNPLKYKKHMRDHGSLPIFQCELCDKAFSDCSNFTKHKKYHNLKVLVCDLCKKKFQAKASLEKHMQEHIEFGRIQCTLCTKEFFSQSMYKKHMRTRHEKTQPRFTCPICRLKFPSLREKWDHLWEVHKERKQIADCHLCGKSYRRVTHLKRHMKLHGMYVKTSNVYDDPVVMVLNTNTPGDQETLVVYE